MHSPRIPNAMIETSNEDARPLALVRCTAFEAGRSEAKAHDGSVQMRLPLGSWIVDLQPEAATGVA